MPAPGPQLTRTPSHRAARGVPRAGALSRRFPPMLSIPGYCSPRKQAFDRGRHPEQPAIMPIACNEHQSNRQPARARQRK